MKTFTLERTQIVGASLEEAWAFYADPGNLEAITPSWLRFRIEEAPAQLEARARLRYRLSLFGVPIRWLTEIVAWSPPRAFVDLQLSGPYPLWEHSHRLSETPAGTEIHDHVRYALPGGPFAGVVDLIVRRWLDAIFDYRSRRTSELLSSTS